MVARLIGAAVLALGLSALPFAAVAEDGYATLKVIGTEAIDIPSGPGDTQAILSPDGSRVFSIGRREVCMFAPAQIGPWAEIKCVAKNPEERIRGPWDMRWSPGGGKLLMPTYMNAFMVFRDTDITIFDAESFATTVLTEDGVDDGLSTNRQPANLDVAARWIDDETIAFIRYAVPAGGLSNREGPWVMTVDVAGGEARQVSKAIIPQGYVLSALAISPDGKQYAYPNEIPDDPDNAGIYLSPFGGAPRRLAPVTGFGRSLSGIEFSADGKFILVLGTTEDMYAQTIAHAVAVETGEVIEIAPGQPLVGVAWAPTGSGLAYITRDLKDPDFAGGLFVADGPGEPGRLLIGGKFNPSICCNSEPFVWASNDTMLLGNGEDASTSVVYVRLGR